MRKGQLIVLEGIDGCGKSTLAQVVARYFAEQGKNVWVTAEPTDSAIGRLARDYLKRKNADYTRALLMAADRQEHTKEIERFLEAPDTVVICDRYKHSALAYQGLTIPAEDINVLNKGNLDPDLVIYIYVSPEVAVNRVDTRGEKKDVFEKVDILRQVRKRYEDMDFGCRSVTINGNLTQDAVASEVRYKLKKEGF